MSGPRDQVQYDMANYSEYKEANDGTGYLFYCIDVFPMYAWSCPLTSKNRTETASAMAAILEGGQYVSGTIPVPAHVPGHSLFYQ